VAVDLGAGFGMHAIPLARRGFNVLAIDACAVLLDQLRAQIDALPIQTIQDDLQSYPRHLSGKPDLVLCMGDTLTHLADEASLVRLIATVSAEISTGGRFVITLRDYSTPLTAEKRFIPVRSDENRILTCFLEYGDSHVTVYDILHERDGSHWNLSVSKYNKLRIAPEWLANSLQENGFAVHQEAGASGMIRFVARRVLRGASPRRERVSHPPVSSLGSMAESGRANKID
jgi:SAM-dependent methyltransferase